MRIMNPPMSKQKPAPEDRPLLTIATIQKELAALARDELLYAELPSAIAARKKWLEAAELVAPVEFAAATKTKKTKPRGNGHDTATIAQVNSKTKASPTWAGEVARILNESHQGLSRKEILAKANETDLGNRRSAGDKGFYNAITRLAKRGEIAKHGGLLYSSKLLKELKARGELLPDVSIGVQIRPGSSGSFVVSALTKHPNGLSAPELKTVLSAERDAPMSLKKHTQFIYNVFGTLIGAGVVTKKDGIYRLAAR